MRELIAAVAAMGLGLHAAHLPAPYRGLFSPDEKRIYFDLGLTPNERRTVIAHELGHAYYGHVHSGIVDADRRMEYQANMHAARLLIDPEQYAMLERTNPDQHELADDLNVTVDLIRFYEQHCLTRLRGVTYARPRLGVNQWAYRGLTA